jgi:hypothetical protein
MTGDVMNISRHEEEPPSSQDKVCIGIALVGGDIRVAARAGGCEVARSSFPANPLGTAALLSYLSNWQAPLRLAVATAGAAALGLALSVGAQQDREVFLVSAHAMHSAQGASDLARYAERAI